MRPLLLLFLLLETSHCECSRMHVYFGFAVRGVHTYNCSPYSFVARSHQIQKERLEYRILLAVADNAAATTTTDAAVIVAVCVGSFGPRAYDNIGTISVFASI